MGITQLLFLLMLAAVWSPAQTVSRSYRSGGPVVVRVQPRPRWQRMPRAPRPYFYRGERRPLLAPRLRRHRRWI